MVAEKIQDLKVIRGVCRTPPWVLYRGWINVKNRKKIKIWKLRYTARIAYDSKILYFLCVHEVKWVLIDGRGRVDVARSMPPARGEVVRMYRDWEIRTAWCGTTELILKYKHLIFSINLLHFIKIKFNFVMK